MAFKKPAMKAYFWFGKQQISLMMIILSPNFICLFGSQGHFKGRLQESLEKTEKIFIKICELLYNIEENCSHYLSMSNEASGCLAGVWDMLPRFQRYQGI